MPTGPLPWHTRTWRPAVGPRTSTLSSAGTWNSGRRSWVVAAMTSATPALSVARRAVELGVDFIDTADSYGPNVSEEILAEALHPYPQGLRIATKVGLVRPGPGIWRPVGRPEYLRQQTELALRKLKTERLELLQLHRLDPQ